MISIHNKKGFDLNITGRPLPEMSKREAPDRVALLPAKIPIVKPRLKVKEGDQVKVGSVVFEDKRNPAIQFMSPGGGKVTEIAFGPVSYTHLTLPTIILPCRSGWSGGD